MVAVDVDELKKIGLSFVVAVIILRILFFDEEWIRLLKTALLVYYVFVLPGIGITYLFKGLSFIERLAASVAINAAVVGIVSYYLGLAGVHIKYSAIILPPLLMLVSAAMLIRRSENVDKNAPEISRPHFQDADS